MMNSLSPSKGVAEMMGKGQKLVTITLWAVTVLLMLALVGTGLWIKRPGEAAHAKTGALFDTPAFTLIDQNGQSFSHESLRGNVWVANFIFTNCAGPCPKMTAMLAELQRRVNRADVKMVSFTVDPRRDTPEILKAYADKYGADPLRWMFLTGSDQQMMQVASAMKTAADKNPDSSITHGTHFFLIDRQGLVRRIYGQSSPDTLDLITKDAVSLADHDRIEESGQ